MIKGIAAIRTLTPYVIKAPTKSELKTTMRFVYEKTGLPMVAGCGGSTNRLERLNPRAQCSKEAPHLKEAPRLQYNF